MNNTEIWKDIEGYEGLYEVSSFGRVRRSYITTPKRIVKPSKITKRKKYQIVTLSRPEIRPITPLVHRLVAKAFIPNPEDKAEVNHKNAVKTDNRVENLEWSTREENDHHSTIMGLRPKGERHHKAKLKQSDADTIRELNKSGIDKYDLAKSYSVCVNTVRNILNNRSWI